MSAVGQLFGGSFLQVALDRFASPELLEFLILWEIDLDEVESLKRTSAMIQALSDEAEVKQFNNGAVKLWLDHLKQLLYDAEDILDEYATELLRLKLESAHQTQQENPKMECISLKMLMDQQNTTWQFHGTLISHMECFSLKMLRNTHKATWQLHGIFQQISAA